MTKVLNGFSLSTLSLVNINPPHKLETSISGGKPYVNAGYILQTLQLQTFNLSFLCANCLWQISVEASKLTQNKDLELDTVQSVLI